MLNLLLKELISISEPAALEQLLREHPSLLESDTDEYLTNRLAEVWKQGERGKTRNGLACRTFLRRCRNEGLEAVFSQPLALPLPQNTPMDRLLKLTYDQKDLLKRSELAQEVLSEVNQVEDFVVWSALQRELADCLAQSNSPERADHIEAALQHYQMLLDSFNESTEVEPRDRGELLYELAAVYRHRIKGDRTKNYQEAVRLYREALALRPEDIFPMEWAEIQHDLGIAWLEMPTKDKAGTVAQGITCFEAALTKRSYDKVPDLWTASTHNLAIAYSQLNNDQRIHNQEKAIELCSSVQKRLSPGSSPVDWGKSQIALGNVYVLRLKGGRVENIEKAIRCYQEAISVLSDYPVDWASAHVNIAVAYRHRLIDDKRLNLEEAIDHLEEALKVYIFAAYPIQWASLQTNLGDIYSQPAMRKLEGALDIAIVCYHNAGKIRTREDDPEGWATLQNSLGNVYAEHSGHKRAEFQKRAVDFYKQALKERTRDEHPARWAETMNNLGAVYSELDYGSPLNNQRKAIKYLSQALEIHTPMHFPNNCRRAARNLGMLLFARQQWLAASQYFRMALKATFYLYQGSVTPAARQVELQQTRELVAVAAYGFAKADSLQEAVGVLEDNRTKALGEALALNEAVLKIVGEEDKEEFLKARDIVAALEAEVREFEQPEARDFWIVSNELEKAREALTAVIQHIRQNQPDFMPEGLAFPEISAIAASLNQPIVYLVTTVYGSAALLVPPFGTMTQQDHVVWCEQFSSFDLQKILGNGVNSQGYLNSIDSGDIIALQNVLSDSWSILNGRFMSNIIARIQKLGFQRAVLIPTGQLSLLPLHAFSEDVVFSVAPSARSLQGSTRCEYGGNGRFLGIGNPLPLPGSMKSLAFAQMEVEEIAAQFPDEDQETFVGEDASLEAVQASQTSAKYLHFACHGGFNLKRPLASSLFLANKGQLTLQQLLDRNLDLSSVQLVILSACKTGVIEFESLPDEVIGFPAGFLQAGVPAVISTLWAINDVSTSFLMRSFYCYHLSEGLSPADALKAAQNWLQHVTASELEKILEKDINAAEENDKAESDLYNNLISEGVKIRGIDAQKRPFSHPYYWASFVYTGP